MVFCCPLGVVDMRINGWAEVSFCLPQKVHKKVNESLFVEPDAIVACLNILRPYHTLLLLQVRVRPDR